jgi:hypothetical protein
VRKTSEAGAGAAAEGQGRRRRRAKGAHSRVGVEEGDAAGRSWGVEDGGGWRVEGGQGGGLADAGPRVASLFGDAHESACSPFYYGNFLPYEVGGWAIPLYGACL